MPILRNPRHEIFACALAQGKSAEAAYREAGYKPSRPHAPRLATNGNIRARVEEIIGSAAVKAEISIERTLQKLAEIGFHEKRTRFLSFAP
jgi:phage terminase small subunit